MSSLVSGIVGLPNSGKSTLFNALMKKQVAHIAEYPYTTIEPNVGVVEVPDDRLYKLAKVLANENSKSETLNPKQIPAYVQTSAGRQSSNDQNLKLPKVVPAAIGFIDIAGLIKGAHKGEGLGNQFLAKIREVDAIIHVVRAFENESVEHVGGKIDPISDIETVKGELELAQINKPTIFVINISENQIKDSSMIQIIELVRSEFKSPAMTVCAKLEAELSELSEAEQRAYLKELGVGKLGLDQIIKESYSLLDLITFFTVAGGKMVQAWPIKKGSTIIEAAEMVHTDFAQGFITAETVNWQKLVDSGSWVHAKENGLVKTAGRNEEIVDGIVVEFKASV